MSQESISTCILCDNPSLIPHKEIPDYFGSKGVFQVVKCKSCDTLYTSPRPDEENIITYYKSSSYVSHGDKVSPIFDAIYSYLQKRNFRYKSKLLQRYTIDTNHLDYGCGNGKFLAFLKSKNWNVSGIEPDSHARQQAEKNTSLTIHDNLDSLDETKQFSSISLFHVLEHVHQLDETITKLVERLSRNGILMLALPNFNSWDAQHYDQHWAGYDVPRHLYHFSQKSMFHLAKKYGLNIVATHPLMFDSYYASLLSGQYMTGKKNYLSAFRQGYTSNKHAQKTKEFSSLIYVLSK